MAALRAAVIPHFESVHAHLRLSLACRAPVNRLPVDVLLTVFAFLPLPNLITVSHVCFHWRSITLDTPTLWGNSVHIAGLRHRLLRYVLTRAKATLLDIFLSGIYGPSAKVQDYISLIAHSMSHSNRLHLEGYAIGNRSVSLHLDFSEGVSCLSSLAIIWASHTTPDWTSSIRTPLTLSIALPNDLSTSNPFASLHHIQLRGVTGGEHFETLLCLSPLRTLDFEVPAMFPLSMILSIIQGSPTLQDVTLAFSNTKRADEAHPWRDTSPEAWLAQHGLIVTALMNLVMTGDGRHGLYARSTIASVVDTSSIRYVSAKLDALSPLGPALLSETDRPTRFQCHLVDVLAEDARGFTRRVQLTSDRGVEHLHPPMLNLKNIVTLDILIECWDLISGPLDCLEHLQLYGQPGELSRVRPTPKVYPALRTVTLELCAESIGWGSRAPPRPSVHWLIAMSAAFVGVRISGYSRPLERLTVLTPANCKKAYVVRDGAFPFSRFQLQQRGWGNTYLSDDSDDPGDDWTSGWEVPGVDWGVGWNLPSVP
ncbi:hypothetical protein EXIGLDRAFT_762263 [Exidia glandulosa HHB12029]|uniref:F-box domain-containing protein n=1 Tax=Exidia glandulosa HHB12029 TaxID=1314781 RepID=A0A165MV02_EXIGL|nr:hypothetical protein EXIGLDRAFT_762263 [Exidia glandulosa HHB12029]